MKFKVTYLGCHGSYYSLTRAQGFGNAEEVEADSVEGAIRSFNNVRGATVGDNRAERYYVEVVFEPTTVEVVRPEPEPADDGIVRIALGDI